MMRTRSKQDSPYHLASPTATRSALKIRLDILEAVRDEGAVNPTRMILLANLSHDRLVKYVGELVCQGLLMEDTDGTSRSYALTRNGLDFIHQVEEMESFVASFGLRM